MGQTYVQHEKERLCSFVHTETINGTIVESVWRSFA